MDTLLTKEMQEKELLQHREEALQEHLQTLQGWNLAEGQTVEQLRRQEEDKIVGEVLEENRVLQKEMQRVHGVIQASQTAPGTPVQQVPAAPDGIKEKWAKRKESKKAKKAFKDKAKAYKKENKNMPNPVERLEALADYRTYRGVNALQEQKQALQVSIDQHLLMVELGGPTADIRVLRSFLQPYQMGADGEPLTEEDRRTLQDNNRFVDDYASGNYERRMPHLERMVKELITTKLTPQMVTPEYIQNHLPEMNLLANRLTYIENVQKDPINRPFFERLPEADKAILEYMNDHLAAQLGMLVPAAAAQIGIESNAGDYLTDDQGLEQVQMLDMLSTNTQAALQGFEDMVIKSTIEATEHEIEKRARDFFERVEGHEDLTYESLTEAQKEILAHPQEYQSNQAVVDAVYRDLFRVSDAREITYRRKMGLAFYRERHIRAGGLDVREGYRWDRYASRYYEGQAQYNNVRLASMDVYELHCKNALDHILKGVEITPESKNYLAGIRARLGQ